MTLPAALPLALWGEHFRQGKISADQLIDHCGPLSLDLIATLRSAEAIELVVVGPGDPSGVHSPALAALMEIESGVYLRGQDLILLPPFWLASPATRSSAPPTRAEAEQLLSTAIELAHATFASSPVFGAEPPSLSEVEFPQEHPSRLRQVLIRAALVGAIAKALANSWSTHPRDAEKNQFVINEMKRASRRGFEAAVGL